MKYIISLILGAAVGMALLAVSLIYNPFVGKQSLSPLSVSASHTIALGYSTVSSENIVYTNNGESREKPFPDTVAELWEAPIRRTAARATLLRDHRDQVAGFGIKFSSDSEETRLLDGEVIFDSVWYLYLPGRGSIFVEQNENHWRYLRDIIVPAYRSTANTWTGIWHGDMTSGPGALKTAIGTGGSGNFAGMNLLAVESLSVEAWSVDQGPVAATGRLIIELPGDSESL